MKNYKKLLTAFLLISTISLFSSVDTKAQDAIFSQFYANPLYLNPAFAGTQCTNINLNYRNHPWPTFGTFSTYSVSYDTDVPVLSGGLGIMAFADRQAGLLATYSVSGVYSYHLSLSDKYSASLGVKAGYYRKELNYENLIFADQYDPYSSTNLPTQESPPQQSSRYNVDFAAGVLVFSDFLFGGVSAYHLSQPDMGFYQAERLPIKMTAHLGFNLLSSNNNTGYRDDKSLSISPNIIYQRQQQYQRLNVGAYFDYWVMTFGSWLRYDFKNNYYLIFLAGINQGNYRIGYSYDYSLSGLYGVMTGVHEISVSLKFNCRTKKSKYRILNCPTF
ncbi:MAG: PorP/SprF family type IX secretion system membrane protein [Bacteroidales bacterium]